MIVTAPRVIPAGPGSGILEPGFVRIADGVITEVGQGPPPGRPDLALDSGVLVPGLVDLQVNGYFGVELMAADRAGWAAVAAGLPATGCTAFLPTFVTAPVPRLAGALRGAAGFAGRLPPGGARVLGVHLEGPFISPARRGAHNPDWIIPAIGSLTAAGVLVSVGHSDATAAQVAAAAGAGARMVTHLYDAQRPLHHREPGVVGQALADPRLTSGLIADLHHVSAVACAVAFAAAPGRICLVTDAAACAGEPPGEYLLGGERIVLLPGDGAPPRRADGTLAGSALRLDRAVANMVRTGADLSAVVAAATRIPADLIGRPDLGRLAPGAAADLTWLDDELRTAATWIEGEKVYP